MYYECMNSHALILEFFQYIAWNRKYHCTRIVLIDLYGRIYLNVIFDVRCTIYKRFNDLQQQFYDDK